MAVKVGRCKDLVGREVRVTKDVVLRSGRVLPRGTIGWIGSTWRGRFTLYEQPGCGGRLLILGASRSDLAILAEKRKKKTKAVG